MALFEPVWKTSKEEKLDEAMAAVRAIEDPKKLRDVAMNALLPEVRLEAVERISDEHLLREIVVGLTFNNLFNARYATSAWVYSSIVRGSYTADNRYYQIGFMPMAGTTAMAHLTLRF